MLALVGALAGCGASSTNSSGSGTVDTASNSQIQGVALINGTPLTASTFDHWLRIAAKTASSNAADTPDVVPYPPPDFAPCIASARTSDREAEACIGR